MAPSIVIFGAGAIGSILAHGLARSGTPARLVARGARLDALRRDGLTLVEGGEENHQSIDVLDAGDTHTSGPVDVVIIALKQQQIEGALPSIMPLIGPETLIVPAINGVPWWYFEGMEGPNANRRIDCLDPSGVLSRSLPTTQILGCVVYIAAEQPSANRVESLGFRKLVLGPAHVGVDPEKIAKLVDVLSAADLRCKVIDEVRREIWMKLWGNIWANPLSVVTRSGMGEMHSDPAMQSLGMAMMRETDKVAASLGVEIPISPEKRIADAGRFGTFKTSMLQDYERGTSMELDGILGAVLEIGRFTGVETPTLDVVHTLTRYIAVRAGVYDYPDA